MTFFSSNWKTTKWTWVGYTDFGRVVSTSEEFSGREERADLNCSLATRKLILSICTANTAFDLLPTIALGTRYLQELSILLPASPRNLRLLRT